MALHEVQLKGYSVRPGNLSLGTFDSYGIEQLHVTVDDTWSGLAVTATFTPPEGEPVERRVPENGLIDVPAEATANEGTGTIVYCGVASGAQRISKTQGYSVITHGNVGTTVEFNPSESLATQVLQAALSAERSSAEAKSVADGLRTDAANGKFNGKDGDKGADGVSPTAAVTQTDDGAKFTVTDASGTTTAAIKNGTNGKDGAPGAAGKDAVVDATLTQDGQAADAKVTGEKIGQLKEDTRNLWKSVADTRAYIGLSDDDILGLQVDYKNKTFKRLAGATNLTAGADFDAFPMYGGRKRCNVADDGAINAWFGDDGYTEDGSNGQVMVYQPKFYYLVCPVVYDPITTTGMGYHLRKANYYVSANPRPGFRLHPAFYDANGNEIEYVMESAFEGSIFDASASAYLLDNEQVMDANADKFCSIAGARPATGHSQNLTRDMVEKLAANRGTGWHGDTIKVESASQLLMIIELGLMNAQNAIGQGVVSLPNGSDTTTPYAAKTGSTSALGNGTGRATSTTTYPGNVETTDTANGKTSVSWRGKENPWGNLWKFVGGMNIYGNGKMDGGQPYICNDFNFNESKHDGNYEAAGFTVTPKEGYISAMGYSTACDWLFVASETNGNSILPVGDYTYVTQNLNGSRIARLGGGWDNGTAVGPFYFGLTGGVGYRYRNVGGRLVYVPNAENQQTVTA